MSTLHKGLTRKKWNSLSLCEQMGNIASETLRVWSCRGDGDAVAADGAFGRALELIDLTMAGDLSGERVRELCRLREVFCDAYLGTGRYEVTPEMINDYLFYFAVRARS